MDFDNRKIGLHGFNIWDDSAGMPFGGCIIMLCVDIVLYAFLAFYLDNVLPSESCSLVSGLKLLNGDVYCVYIATT